MEAGLVWLSGFLVLAKVQDTWHLGPLGSPRVLPASHLACPCRGELYPRAPAGMQGERWPWGPRAIGPRGRIFGRATTDRGSKEGASAVVSQQRQV